MAKRGRSFGSALFLGRLLACAWRALLRERRRVAMWRIASARSPCAPAAHDVSCQRHGPGGGEGL